MINRPIVLFSICLILTFSTCVNKSNEANKEMVFHEFLKKQNIIELPLMINLYQNYYDLVDPNSSDSVIFHEKTSMSCLGILNDTTKYYYVIRMFPGDDLCPILYVLSKNGNIIEKTKLYIGKYGIDCGSHIYGYTTISKELKIHTQDSLVQYSCDSSGYEIKGSLKILITNQESYIKSDGKVKQLNATQKEQ